MKYFIGVLTLLLLLSASTVFADVCVQSDSCPAGQICARDINGRGICVERPSGEQPLAGASVEIGMKGNACVFPSDCNSGICDRPQGYLGQGVCR